MSNYIKTYTSFVIVSHTVFALPFAIIGYIIALHDGFQFSFQLLGLILICMFLGRNAAMSFNRLTDASIDAKNPRTQNREIPGKRISKKEAFFFTLINSILFITTTYFINTLCFSLSFVALGVILSYSYLKRFTFITHFILGLGLSFAPIGAYIAASGQFSVTPILLSLAVLFWVAGFDILYSLQDEDFDKQYNLHSIPALFGYKKAVLISVGCQIISMSCLIYLGYQLGYAGLFYWLGLAIFIIMSVLQILKIKQDQLHLINRNFLLFNGWASILFCVFFFLNHLSII